MPFIALRTDKTIQDGNATLNCLVLMECGLWGFASETEEQPGKDAAARVINA